MCVPQANEDRRALAVPAGRRALACSVERFLDGECGPHILSTIRDEDVEPYARALSYEGFAGHHIGNHKTAYCANRNAATLYRHLGDNESATQHLLYCLANLRPVAESRMIRETVFDLHSHFIATGAQLGRFRAPFLTELGIICFDYGHGDAARHLCRRAASLYSTHHDELAASLGEREAAINEASNLRRIYHIEGLDNLDRGLSGLGEMVERAKALKTPVGLGVTLFSQLALYVHHSEHAAALAFAEANEEDLQKATKWTQVVTRSVTGFLLENRGDHDRAANILRGALREMLAFGLQAPVMDVWSDAAPFRPDLLLARNYGQPECFLAERGPLPLTADELRRVTELPADGKDPDLRSALRAQCQVDGESVRSEKGVFETVFVERALRSGEYFAASRATLAEARRQADGRRYDVIVDEVRETIQIKGRGIKKIPNGTRRRGMLGVLMVFMGQPVTPGTVSSLFGMERDDLNTSFYQLRYELRQIVGKLADRIMPRRALRVAGAGWSFLWIRRQERQSSLFDGLAYNPLERRG